ncbi:MAG TPA: hypothetical protein VGO58_01685 [Chitinophagaceae bacterium]|jgi:hypothetical protein|nr:hypothetical protein [Chitinophagaceae bacterium]
MWFSERNSGKSFLLSIILLGAGLWSKAMACDCESVRSVEQEFTDSYLVIKGHIIATDTVSYLSAAYPDQRGLRFGIGKRRFKPVADREYFLRVTVVVDTNYKSSTVLPDTIYVITAREGSGCGIYFPYYMDLPGIPKGFYDFVIYGSRYSYGAIVEKKQKKKTTREIITSYSANTFVTNSCRRTRRADPFELAALNGLKR